MADDNSDIQDLDLDQVLGTGENKDREPVVIKEEKDSPPNSSDTGEEEKKDDIIQENEDEKSDGVSEEEEFKNLLNTFTTNDLSEEDKELKNDLLSKHKGAGFNANGDLVDNQGQVIKTSDELYEDINKEEVLLDNKGNQIDENGKIVKSKFELAAENSYVNKRHKESGYSFQDENGEVKIYEDSDEGLDSFTNDLAEEKAKEINARLFNSNPIIPEVIKHLLSGKDLDSFNKITDYEKVEPKSLNKDEKLAYIKQSLLVSGMPKDRVETYLNLIVDSNKVDSELQASLANLQENQEEQKAKRNQEYQEAVQKQQKETVDYWKGVEDQIKADKVKFVTIPEKEKDSFYNYMSMAIDDNGNSQHLLDKQNQPLEEEIGLAYLRFKGFNFDSVINKKVNEKKVLSIRERLKRSTNKVNSSTASTKGSKVNPADVDMRISDILP